MNLFQASKSILISKPFTFAGRAPRSEYLWSFLISIVTVLISGAIPEDYFGVQICYLVFLAYLSFAFFSLQIRRLHDRGYSAWVVLYPAYFFTPGYVIAKSGTGISSVLVLGALIMFIGIAIAIYFQIQCLLGSDADNSYGPSVINAVP
jgi:uncharacterized membrane protein YhaH (DUF805 family)